MPEALMGRKAAGYRQGYAKGVQQGLRKGMQKGIKEGLRKGAIDGMRRVILKQIHQRFDPVPASMQRQIETIGEVRALERIAGALLKASDLGQLRRLAGHGKNAPKRKRKSFSARRQGPAATVSKRWPRRMPPVRYPY